MPNLVFVSAGGRADAGHEVTVLLGWSDALIRQEVIQKAPLVPGGGAHRALGRGSIGSVRIDEGIEE